MAIGDILGGAAGGALTGSSLGPWGALGGGVLGGILGAFGNKKGVLKNEDTVREFDRYTPQQQALLDQLMAALTGQGQGPTGGILGSLLGEEGFDAYKNPALRTYFEEIVPGIAERFTAGNAQRSSAFQNALARSGETLATKLGELRGQQQQNLLGMLLPSLLTESKYRMFQQGGPTGLGSFLGGIAPSLGQALGTGLGNRLSGNLFKG